VRLADEIRALGYSVDEFVLRVNGVLDIYLPSGKWHDMRTGERGRKPLNQLIPFIEFKLQNLKGQLCEQKEKQ